MRLVLRLNAEGAAFEGNGAAPEIARILRNLADRLEEHLPVPGDRFVLRDINGNDVGYLERYGRRLGDGEQP